MNDKRPEPAVSRGDRRGQVWIEADKDQIAKVRHTFPAQGAVEEQSEASEEGRAAPTGDVAIAPEEASAWEALEEGDDSS
ncbi:MAG TPA: hypothetical protein VD906_08430 [Caulobacteraceae bacterium]|nr:hypothetical protein [Caulobacteraceae bacterium]